MKSALRARDVARLGAIRLAVAAIKQREVDERIELDDDRVLEVLERMIKQRRESISQFQSGGREDLASKEAFEIGVIQSYLPEPLSDAELDDIIQAAILSTKAESLRDMGKAMAAIKAKARGRADMVVISAKVKARLQG
jgi:uncharacterized protein YqeY